MVKELFVAILLLHTLSINAFAKPDNNESLKESPWLFAPLIRSTPKLGTSLGAMAGYIYKFDDISPASTFALLVNVA